MHTRSMLLQGQAALVALVLVASQIGSHLHAATERHARCPEHGELVHVDELPRAAATSAVAASAAASDALRDTSAASDEHAHEHCYLCPASRERLAPGQDAGVIAAVLPAAVSHPLPAVASAPGQPRYVIAPKTSPPAAPV
jgi:hypothetical protein